MDALAPGQAKRMPFVLLLVALVVGAMSLLLALNTASAAHEVARHDAAVADTSLAAQLVDLRNQINASAAPGNIARVAQGLGMVPADAPAFLRIDAGGKVALLGSPAAASAPAAPPVSTPKSTPTPSHPASSSSSSSASSSTTSSAKPGSQGTPAQGGGAKSTPVNSAAHTTPATSPAPPPNPPSTFSLGGGAR